MSAKLSEFDRLRIIVDYLELGSVSLTAKKSGISESSVRRAIRDRKKLAGLVSGDGEEREDLSEKSRRTASGIIEKCLSVLNDEDKLRDASVSQLTSAISSLKDCFIDVDETAEIADDPLSRGLMELARSLKGDVPE